MQLSCRVPLHANLMNAQLSAHVSDQFSGFSIMCLFQIKTTFGSSHELWLSRWQLSGEQLFGLDCPFGLTASDETDGPLFGSLC